MIKYILISVVLFSQIQGQTYVEISNDRDFKYITSYKKERSKKGGTILRKTKIEKYTLLRDYVYVVKYINEFKYSDQRNMLVSKKRYFPNGKLKWSKTLEMNREEGKYYELVKSWKQDGEFMGDEKWEVPSRGHWERTH